VGGKVAMEDGERVLMSARCLMWWTRAFGKTMGAMWGVGLLFVCFLGSAAEIVSQSQAVTELQSLPAGITLSVQMGSYRFALER
jgi:hypothetical protein